MSSTVCVARTSNNYLSNSSTDHIAQQTPVWTNTANQQNGQYVRTVAYNGLSQTSVTDPQGNTITYTYDANGNILTGGGATISWTSYNMVNSMVQGSQRAAPSCTGRSINGLNRQPPTTGRTSPPGTSMALNWRRTPPATSQKQSITSLEKSSTVKPARVQHPRAPKPNTCTKTTWAASP